MAARVSAAEEDFVGCTACPGERMGTARQDSIVLGERILRLPRAGRSTPRAAPGWKFCDFCAAATAPAAEGWSVVDFGVGVGRFQLVAGREHGQAADHTIHIEAVGRTGSRAGTQLGQDMALLKCQRNEACAL